jgi:hypothetical protein
MFAYYSIFHSRGEVKSSCKYPGSGKIVQNSFEILAYKNILKIDWLSTNQNP